MKIIDKKIMLKDLKAFEEKKYFSDMVKAVVDIESKIIAVSAELHSDLEEFLIASGSEQRNLYGINIYYDDGEIEFDSAINPPRNRDAGYPKVGRYVACPEARAKITEVVYSWIQY